MARGQVSAAFRVLREAFGVPLTVSTIGADPLVVRHGK